MGEIRPQVDESQLKARFHLQIYSAYVGFGILENTSNVRDALDNSLGSGEGAFGSEDFLRFDMDSKQLSGGLFSIPLSGFENITIPGAVLASSNPNKWKLLGNSLSVPACQKAFLDVEKRLIVCSVEPTIPDFHHVKLSAVSTGVNLIFRGNHYAGFVLSDPLALLPNADRPTLISDYRILSAFFWPHNDDVFEHILCDDDDALKAYYKGLEAALGNYTSSDTLTAKLFKNAFAFG